MTPISSLQAHLLCIFVLLGAIYASINLVTYDEAFSQCSTVDEQQIIPDSTCTSVNFGNGVYSVLIDCASSTLSSSWTFNLYQSSQFGCVNIRPYRLLTGSASGDGCFIAVISYTEYQYFSVRCDASLVNVSPTFPPTERPTVFPSLTPTRVPTFAQTNSPTPQPSSARPTTQPTRTPTAQPTIVPSCSPTFTITASPSATPTFLPGLSYTAIYTAYQSKCAGSVAQKTYNSGSIPDKGNCSTIPVLMHSADSNASTTVFNLPGRVHCYDTSNWIIELFSEEQCLVSSTIFQFESSTVGCFSGSNISFSYNGSLVRNASMEYSVSCLEVLKTKSPTFSPTTRPVPTVHPTRPPSFIPTRQPTVTPTTRPTALPSLRPSCAPSQFPTVSPTHVPSFSPSARPSHQPSFAPTRAPTTPRPSISLRPSTFAPTRPTSILARIRLFSSPTSTETAPTTINTAAIAAWSLEDEIITEPSSNSDSDVGGKEFEGFIAPAEDYSPVLSQNVIPKKLSALSVGTTAVATSVISYTTSCTKSLATLTPLQELGSWTVSRSSCIPISALASLNGNAEVFNNSFASFFVTCMPRRYSASGEVSFGWQVSTYLSSTMCVGAVHATYYGSSSCACGSSNTTIIKSSGSSSYKVLGMMVDCDFSTESDQCDTSEVASTKRNGAFSINTSTGLGNIVSVIVAAVIFLIAVLWGARSAWRKYLIELGEDPEMSLCTQERLLHIFDLLIGRWVVRFGKLCCACICCWCACWIVPSDSVTPSDDEGDDDEEGDDIFDANAVRSRGRVAAVLTMADIQMLDTMEQGQGLDAATVEAIAVRRRMSNASTTSTATLQVTARPYDDSLDFALPTAQLAANSNRPRRHRASSTSPGGLLSWMFPTYFASSHRNGRHRRGATTTSNAETASSETVITAEPLSPAVANDENTAVNDLQLPSLTSSQRSSRYVSPDVSPRRRNRISVQESDNSDDSSSSENSEANEDEWDQYLQRYSAASQSVSNSSSAASAARQPLQRHRSGGGTSTRTTSQRQREINFSDMSAASGGELVENDATSVYSVPSSSPPPTYRRQSQSQTPVNRNAIQNPTGSNLSGSQNSRAIVHSSTGSSRSNRSSTVSDNSNSTNRHANNSHTNSSPNTNNRRRQMSAAHERRQSSTTSSPQRSRR